ncbi:MAG: glycerophosphodiester phosphodiesterase [Kineosporiaceae bacterium]|nr:glycerophosphodiester phosphodiesterase [Kineosporiaceae bacterium]
MATHPYLDWPGPIAFAHRGGASEAPENTAPAFEHAIRLGFTYLETDVHVTADGVLVAFHDEDLSRTCDRPGRIAQLPWSQVRTALVADQAPIPLLEDLLGAWPHARWNIDCKVDGAVPALVDTLRRCSALDRVGVGSFSDSRLRRIRRELGPELCTSLATREAAAWVTGLPLVTSALIAQVPVRHRGVRVVSERTVARAHRRGWQVHVWTVNEADEMHRLLELGVDGLMTDRPAVLRQVLLDRGQWN